VSFRVDSWIVFAAQNEKERNSVPFAVADGQDSMPVSLITSRVRAIRSRERYWIAWYLLIRNDTKSDL